MSFVPLSENTAPSNALPPYSDRKQRFPLRSATPKKETTPGKKQTPLHNLINRNCWDHSPISVPPVNKPEVAETPHCASCEISPVVREAETVQVLQSMVNRSPLIDISGSPVQLKSVQKLTEYWEFKQSGSPDTPLFGSQNDVSFSEESPFNFVEQQELPEGASELDETIDRVEVTSRDEQAIRGHIIEDCTEVVSPTALIPAVVLNVPSLDESTSQSGDHSVNIDRVEKENEVPPSSPIVYRVTRPSTPSPIQYSTPVDQQSIAKSWSVTPKCVVRQWNPTIVSMARISTSTTTDPDECQSDHIPSFTPLAANTVHYGDQSNDGMMDSPVTDITSETTMIGKVLQSEIAPCESSSVYAETVNSCTSTPVRGISCTVANDDSYVHAINKSSTPLSHVRKAQDAKAEFIDLKLCHSTPVKLCNISEDTVCQDKLVGTIQTSVNDASTSPIKHIPINSSTHFDTADILVEPVETGYESLSVADAGETTFAEITSASSNQSFDSIAVNADTSDNTHSVHVSETNIHPPVNARKRKNKDVVDAKASPKKKQVPNKPKKAEAKPKTLTSKSKAKAKAKANSKTKK